MERFEIPIILDPEGAEGELALVYNPNSQNLSFRIWDLSRDFNYDPYCENPRPSYHTEYMVGDRLHALIMERFSETKADVLYSTLNIEVHKTEPLRRTLEIYDFDDIIEIDELKTSVSRFLPFQPEQGPEKLRERRKDASKIRRTNTVYSLRSAIHIGDHYFVKENCLQQNLKRHLENNVVENGCYFELALISFYAPETFNVLFDNGEVGVQYAFGVFAKCLDIYRNKELMDVLIEHEFDFNYDADFDYDVVGFLCAFSDRYLLAPLIKATRFTIESSQLSHWHVACRYMMDRGGADIEAKIYDKVMRSADVAQESGQTLLMQASIGGYKNAVLSLLELGANPDALFQGRHLWDICHHKEICAMLKEASESRAAGIPPKHMPGKLFIHPHFELFLGAGNLRQVQVLLDLSTNPDLVINELFSRGICQNPAACELLEEALHSVKADRRLQKRKLRLDAEIPPSRRTSLHDIRYKGDAEFNRLLRNAKETESQEDLKKLDARHLLIRDRIREYYRRRYSHDLQ